jgi:hypothetical protein
VLSTNGSGTLGWTSIASPDLTNYVTTNTEQTITEAKTFSKDLSVNAITVGKGGGNQGSNIAFGTTALTSNTTGGSNTAIGHRTLSNNLGGGDNTAVGANALRFNTGNFSQLKGTYNTALGSSSLNANTEGSYNTATGANALLNNTLGDRNTAIGHDAGRYIANGSTANTTSDFSVYLGSNTKASADDAQNEIVIGYNAIGAGSNTIQLGNTAVTDVKTSGNLTVNGITVGRGRLNVISNTAIGGSALSLNTDGSFNTAIGYRTLSANTTGYNNTATGADALNSNSTGFFNTAYGSSTLLLNTTGVGNTAIGTSALLSNSTGSGNTAIGYGADVASDILTNATAIGYGAIVSTNHTIRLGNSDVATIGGQVNWTAASDSRIKKNIVNSNYGLATVLKLRPVEYNLISNDLKQVGFIAQEVQKLVPEVVTGKEGDLSKGEILGITYSNLVPVLTKAIQEQQKQIEDQNAKIAAQQKQIEELIKLMKELKK